MDSLDAFIYQEIWKYCLRKCPGRAKRAYHNYTLSRPLRQAGLFQLGLVVGEQTVRLPRLSGIPRKVLTLGYPAPASREAQRPPLPYTGITDEQGWERHVWGGQEGSRIGQQRLAAEILARDPVCQLCQEQPATQVHHEPPWQDQPVHDPGTAMGVCSSCHWQMRSSVGKSNGELR